MDNLVVLNQPVGVKLEKNAKGIFTYEISLKGDSLAIIMKQLRDTQNELEANYGTGNVVGQGE